MERMMDMKRRIKNYLIFLYGPDLGTKTWTQLDRRLTEFSNRNPQHQENIQETGDRLTELDTILITYGDQFSERVRPPLQSLGKFLADHLTGTINSIHILPFYPYSSDDGFSVIDYRQVDPKLGTWDDIALIAKNYRMMYDAVINHISRKSLWFEGYLNSKAPYADYFITVDPANDLSMVVRPRALPLLTAVETKTGTQHVWTTFSDDQIDLNYATPEVLLEVIDILLLYVEQGAEFIRLDAIAYLWKEIGTSCIHLTQTHVVVKLWRAIFEMIAPYVTIITETNVPHDENVSYFGEPRPGSDNYDEAHMVYQFPLAPLILHAFRTGNAQQLSKWVASLYTPSKDTTFFNFIASHDGIGVMPAHGLLGDGEIQALVDQTIRHGGQVSFKTNPDGSKSVYELNITLFDYLNNPSNPDEDLDVKRFIASQAIMISLAGIPGIYIHSLFGSRNCHDCYRETGRARSLNREKFDLEELETALNDPDSNKSKVFSEYVQLLRERRNHTAFHPNGPQRIFPINEAVFSIMRESPDGKELLWVLINVTDKSLSIPVELNETDIPITDSWFDLLEGTEFFPSQGKLSFDFRPFQIRWLQKS
jgi:sucrose phosphorylase